MGVKILLLVFLSVSILSCSKNERKGAFFHCFVCYRSNYGAMKRLGVGTDEKE